MTEEANRITKRKRKLRVEAAEKRRDQPNKDEASRKILASAMALPEYHEAGTVMFYVDVRNEVRTRDALRETLESQKRIVVPYCDAGELRLFHLLSFDELKTGAYGISEPSSDIRSDLRRSVDAAELDVVLAPGVAFDRNGGRLGHGKGYYDRLLKRLEGRAHIIGLAFECQMFAEVPQDEHDVCMDAVVTENDIYVCRQRTK